MLSTTPPYPVAQANETQAIPTDQRILWKTAKRTETVRDGVTLPSKVFQGFVHNKTKRDERVATTQRMA